MFFQAVNAAVVRQAGPPAPAFVTSNLCSYWDADIQGNPWPDQHLLYNTTSRAYNLSMVNGASFTTIGGVNAAYFDGVNDYAVVGGVGTGDPLQVSTLLNYTNEFWIRSNGSWLSQGNFWAAAYNNGSRSRWESGVKIYAPNIDSFNTVYGNTTVWTTNTWHHMVVTMENLGTNDRIRVYKNGTTVAVDTLGNYAPNLNYVDFYLASYNGAGEYQRQYIGLCRRYNRALDSTEVQQNFNAERARFGI